MACEPARGSSSLLQLGKKGGLPAGIDLGAPKGAS